jgi:hypothetical protein
MQERGLPAKPSQYTMDIMLRAERLRGAGKTETFNGIKNILMDSNSDIKTARTVGADTSLAYTLFSRVMVFLYEDRLDEALKCALQYRAESIRLLINFDGAWENGTLGRGD